MLFTRCIKRSGLLQICRKRKNFFADSRICVDQFPIFYQSDPDLSFHLQSLLFLSQTAIFFSGKIFRWLTQPTHQGNLLIMLVTSTMENLCPIGFALTGSYPVSVHDTMIGSATEPELRRAERDQINDAFRLGSEYDLIYIFKSFRIYRVFEL